MVIIFQIIFPLCYCDCWITFKKSHLKQMRKANVFQKDSQKILSEWNFNSVNIVQTNTSLDLVLIFHLCWWPFSPFDAKVTAVPVLLPPSAGFVCWPPKWLQFPWLESFLSYAHAYSFVLLWTAVGENGSTHARTAGKTSQDFCYLLRYLGVSKRRLSILKHYSHYCCFSWTGGSYRVSS